MLGILCIGLTLIATTGLASYLKFPYGPVHSVIPILLLGNYNYVVYVCACMHTYVCVCACVCVCVCVRASVCVCTFAHDFVR